MTTDTRHNYTIVGKIALRDKRISIGAKGLYAFLSMVPQGKSVKKTSLPPYFKEGKTAVNSRFDELVRHGYIKVTRQTIDGMSRHCYELLQEPNNS